MVIDPGDPQVVGDAEPPRAPTTEELLHPVLQVLSDGQTRDVRAVAEMVADLLDLDEAARALKVPSGMSRVEHRVGWARTSLVRAGLLEQPRESAMRITDAGRYTMESSPLRGATLLSIWRPSIRFA